MMEEDYWNSSKASKIKAFGINQFDDQTMFQDVFKALQKFDPEDFDDDDIINWDGTKPTKSGHLSARHKAPQSSDSLPQSQSNPSLGSVNNNRPVGRPTSIQGPDLSTLSIDDVVKPKLAVGTKTDVAKLEAEVNYLRRTVKNKQVERWQVLPVCETVRRIIFGEEFTLELYKSREQKLQLIDEAIRCHDGNAIITTIIFLRDTVKKSIFNLELTMRPIAIDHYVTFLKLMGDTENLMDVYAMLHRNEEAAMLKFKQATSIKDPETKQKSLITCKRAHFDSEPSLQHDAALIQEQITALEQQLPVEISDKAIEMAGTDPILKQFPRVASIVDQPVMTWLFYCCLYHYELGSNYFASPASIRKVHRLTDKQFTWIALMARAKLKAWKDLESLFTSKGWLGSTKMKTPVGFHRIIPVLLSYNAPREILNKYCMLVDDVEVRLEVAQKYNCYEAAIDTIIQLRDRQQLMAYHKKLKENSQEWFYAGERLKNSNTKWKN